MIQRYSLSSLRAGFCESWMLTVLSEGDYVFTLTLRQPELFIGCAPAYVNPTPELRRDYF
ncbi:hypothetical protein JSMCR1_p226 (plasmid) [Escherichia coli]|nr:hypothetical protein JSMCR1_p226 [Escherichia coli]